MDEFQQQLKKYAALAVEVGVNVQPDQVLVVSAPLYAAEYVRHVVRRAYEVGAKYVHVDWSDDIIARMRYELAPEDSFDEYPLMWRAKGWEEMAKNNACFLSITGSNPDLLAGVDPVRVQKATSARNTAMMPFRRMSMAEKISWSIVAVPPQEWANKVFPDLDVEARVPALWEAIFQSTRIDQHDPVQAWREHTKILDEKADCLNQRKYKALHYKAPDTDLTIELPAAHHWVSAGSKNEKGTLFIANMPTEEVFTAPLKTGVNGKVRSTKPLSYAGNLIENIQLEFKDGEIVNVSADSGYDTLKNLIETDEGSRFLGEVALVPHHSPISKTNIIFHNTLFDENASHHLAIGKAYAFCLEGGSTMSQEEQNEHGLNDSITHVDFMIGSAEMDIDGILPDGSREPVFRQGDWAF